MSDLMSKIPVKDEVWEHVKTGNRYVIEGSTFNVVTQAVEVLYAPLYECEFSRFNRPFQDHPKAWTGCNEDGEPRFRLVPHGKPKYALDDEPDELQDEVHLALKGAGLT